MEVNGQLHIPAVLPPGKSGRCLLNRRLKSTYELEFPVMAVGKSGLQHFAVNYVISAFNPCAAQRSLQYYIVYRKVSVQKSYVLPKQCFCMSSNDRHGHISNVTNFTYLSTHKSHIYCHIHEMIYDMIYLSPAVGVSPGASSTVRIYTQTIHRTTQIYDRTTQLTTNLEQLGRAPFLRVLP
jgi:hypothetical protein